MHGDVGSGGAGGCSCSRRKVSVHFCCVVVASWFGMEVLVHGDVGCGGFWCVFLLATQGFGAFFLRRDFGMWVLVGSSACVLLATQGFGSF